MQAHAVAPTLAESPHGAAETLVAQDVSVHFQGLAAVDRVDLTLTQGELLGLIGPNGAGKTTLVNALCGVQRLTAGQGLLAGGDVTGWVARTVGRDGPVRALPGGRGFGGPRDSP